MAKLDKVIESVLRESIADDAAELVGIEKDDVEARISGLSFANYLELGNAVDIEDAETAREILGTVSAIEEGAVKRSMEDDAYNMSRQEFIKKHGEESADFWDNLNESLVDEEKLLDKPTPTLKDLAKKHDISLGDMGAQLAMGIKAEKEHTSDMLVAKEIALDHLNELPDYYTKLEQMEEAGKETRWPKPRDPWKGDNPVPDKFKKDGKVMTRRKGYQEWLQAEKDAARKARLGEADNPYAAPKAAPAPAAIPAQSAASSIDALAQPNATSNDVDNEENQRKEVDDLTIGDDIEVIDISGDPTAVTVKNPRGPGETLIVQTDKGEEHMIKKLAVSGTPKLQELAENFEREIDEMRAGDFDDSIRQTPLYVALFKVSKVPGWAREYVEQGDLLYWNNRRDSLITVEGGKAIGLTATAVSFIGHYKFGDILDGNFGKLEEAELNEDYYDSEGDGASLARDLGTYGWIVYISWSRDDLDYALYKNIDKDNNRGDYRFLKIDKATGSWQTQRSKRNDEMATESGDAAELMHVIKAIEASETVEEGQNARKTEHSGAKKGKGAYYGQKKTAKRDSNKKRRENDKQAVNENESFFFFLDPDGRGDGATVMSSKGDIHDHYEDTETAMQEVRRLNAEFGKDNDGNPIGVNESVLSDHVKIEYRDPDGRYIIVTAGVAGYWAIGKGRYSDDFDRTSFKTLDDAMNDAQETVSNLDEDFSRIMELAGLKETSSAGGTGAGAIASAPAAMNGMQSRNQSIYGKTTKKPKPKVRTKESTEDGIGRNKK